VKALRRVRGLSQEELGLRINADQAYISRIEAGRQNPTLESLAELAQALDAPIDSLFARKA
jgi:transcriptional regulator with XRE-family HTH domain